MLDLIIKNGQCYIDGELKDADVAVKDGKILKIGEITEEAKETVNAEGQTGLPGCIDTQTNIREPRSEARRVGKASRSRATPSHWIKQKRSEHVTK